MMKKSFFFLPLLMITLLSCDPTILFDDDSDNNNNHITKDLQRATLKFPSPFFRFNKDSLAHQYRDPILIDIHLNGSSIPAQAKDLKGVDSATGNHFTYYLVIQPNRDLYTVLGAKPASTLHDTLETGYVLDPETLFQHGGIMLQANDDSMDMESIVFTLYREDLSTSGSFGSSLTQVSEGVSVSINARYEQPKLTARIRSSSTDTRQILYADGSKSFTFVVTDFTLDDNPLGPNNRALFRVKPYFSLGEIYNPNHEDVTDLFQCDVEVLHNGDLEVTISAKGVPTGEDYNFYLTPFLDGAEGIGSGIIKSYYISVQYR